MRQAFPEVVEERSERDQETDQSNTVHFASRFVRDLREIKLTPVCLPVAVFVVADAWSVNCRNSDASTRGVVDRFFQIRVLQIPRTVVAVNPIGRHQDRPSRRSCRPTLDQVGQREIWATVTPLVPNGRRRAFAASE